MPAIKPMIDDQGRQLNAQLRMNMRGEGFRLRVLPIPGVGMEWEFGEALDLALQRLSDLGLLILDALVMNPPARRLPPAQRRLLVSGETYPILAQPGEATTEIAFWLHYRATQIAREKFASQSGVPRVAIDIRLRLPRFEIDTLPFLQGEWKRMRTESEAVAQSPEDVAQPPDVPPPAVALATPPAASDPADHGPAHQFAAAVVSPTDPVPELPLVRTDSGSRGQGRLQDAELRSLIDAYAMQRAIAHFHEQGWQVTDVSAFAPFDLRCTRDGRELHVEVKGSTTAARSILLTRNEVQHARDYEDTALFVVSHIEIVFADGARVARSGNARLYQPWKINAQDLEAQTYSLMLRES